MDISNNINSAIVSGTLGIQRASKEITQNTSNLGEIYKQKSMKNRFEIYENMIANAVGENYENVHGVEARMKKLMFRQLPKS